MLAKLTVVSLFISALTLGGVDKMYIKEYNNNGVLLSEGWMLNDSKIDFWKHYNQDGVLLSKGHYENDKKSGYWYFYNSDGKVIKEGHYTNGIAENWWIFHDLATQTKQKIQYQNNQKNGFCLVYKGRRLKRVDKYVNDKLRGSWTDVSSFRKDNPDVSF